MTVWEWISHGGWLTSPEPTASKRWHPAGGEVGKQAWRERGCWDSACGLLNNHLLALGFFCPPSVPFLISTEVLVTVLLSLVPSSQTNMSERASPVNSKRWRDSGSDSEETCHHCWEGISEPGGRWSPPLSPPRLGIISQEGGKDGLGEAAPQLGRGTCISTLHPPHLKPQASRDHSPPFFP